MPRKFANTAADPLLPRTPIEIDGKTYYLCFDYRALREAEYEYRLRGHHANLLANFRDFSFESVSSVFPCALHRFHPEITWEKAQAMVDLGTVFSIGEAILAAWQAAMPKPVTTEEAPPPNPPAP
jgi:hypothetical protein